MSTDERLARSLQAGEYIKARQQAHRHRHPNPHQQQQQRQGNGEQINEFHRQLRHQRTRLHEAEQRDRPHSSGSRPHGQVPQVALERMLQLMANPRFQQQHRNSSHTHHQIMLIPLSQMLRTGILRRRQPRGANSEQIEDNSGKFVLQDKEKLTDENKSCTVCLMEFENGEELRALPCLHLFHPDCVDRWLQQNPKCPTCRVCIFNLFGMRIPIALALRSIRNKSKNNENRLTLLGTHKMQMHPVAE